MCRTVCLRHRGPRVPCGSRRSVPQRVRQEPCVRGAYPPPPPALPDAKHQLAPLSLLREREFDRRHIGLRTEPVRCCHVFRVRDHGTARGSNRSAGTRRVFMEPTVRLGVEHWPVAAHLKVCRAASDGQVCQIYLRLLLETPCIRSSRANARSIGRVPPCSRCSLTRTLPSIVRGPVDRYHGFQFLMSLLGALVALVSSRSPCSASKSLVCLF